MTFRHDRLTRALAAGLAVLLAAGCEEGAPPLGPVEQARADIASGDPLGAEIALEALLEAGAPRRDVAALLGESALMEGDLAKAREWLGPGQFSEATRGHGFRMLGRLEMAEGDLAAAGKAYDTALTVTPADSELWVDIGRLRYRGGEQLQAIAAAERAVALAPDNPSALQFRGQLARDAEGLATAAQWFARALERQPGNLELRADLAATLGDAGRAREALAALREGEGAEKPNSRVLYIQAVIAARGGDNSLAQTLLARSGRAEADIPAALMLSALLDCAEGNFASAAQTLDRLGAMQPDNRRVRELLAFALSRSGGELELIDRFGARALRQGGSPYLRIMVGRAYEALGNRAAAGRFLDLAAQPGGGLAILPAGSPASGMGRSTVRDAVRIALGARNFAAANAHAAAFVRSNPGSGDALALLGDSFLAQGRRGAARHAYSRSASIRQPWPLMLRMLTAQDRRSGALGVLEVYVRQHPANGEAAALLAEAYAAGNEWARAVLLLDHAIAHGHGRTPFVLAARSVAAANSGDSEGALNFALTAHALQPMSAEATAALIAALPETEGEARAELTQKLRSLTSR